MRLKGISVLVAVLFLCAAPLSACRGRDDEDHTHSYESSDTDDSNVTVDSSGTGDEYPEVLVFEEVQGGYAVASVGSVRSREVTIPSEYMGRPVISIGSSAFSGCSTVCEITIADSVVSIGDEAFSSCINLSGVTFGAGLKRIGAEAFKSCFSLGALRLPEGLTEIGEKAFALCETLGKYGEGDTLQYGGQSIPMLRLPNTVTAIGRRAFWGCGGVQAIYVGGVRSYGDNAFEDCNIRFVEIGDVRAFCEADFGNGGSPFYKGAFIVSGDEAASEIVIPEGTTRISAHAFNLCRMIGRIVIPRSVLSIGEGAFAIFNPFGECVVEYAGTQEEWDSVEKQGDWIVGSYSVVCGG